MFLSLVELCAHKRSTFPFIIAHTYARTYVRREGGNCKRDIATSYFVLTFADVQDVQDSKAREVI